MKRALPRARLVLVAVAMTWSCSAADTTGGTGRARDVTVVRTHEPSPPGRAQIHLQTCDAGGLSACHAAALDQYYAPRTPATDQGALAYFRKACDGGYAASCNGVGTMFREGRGVAQDDTEAVRWFRASCAQDGSTGCEHLAQALEYGQGVAKDDDAARRARERGRCLAELAFKPDAGACPPCP